jgi:hypothetical protein
LPEIKKEDPSENDSDELLSPKNQVVPLSDTFVNPDEDSEDSARNKVLDDEEVDEIVIDTEMQPKVSVFCRPKMCKKCVLFCYRPKGAKHESCPQIFFPSFFKAKA